MKIQLLNERAKVPTRANPWDAAVDLYACDSVWIDAYTRAIVDTGVAIELPDSYVGYVCPRSGLAFKSGVTVLNAPGVIDSGYRGSIRVILINHSDDPVKVIVGDRIAQLVIQQVAFPDFEVVDELSGSTRGQNGFGSSGK